MTFLSSKSRNSLRRFVRNQFIARRVIRGLVGDSHLDVTLADDTTLTKSSHFTHRIVRHDPGGAARTLTLPTEADMDGFFGLLVNAADKNEKLTVKEDAESTTIATVEQNQACILAGDGTSWWGLLLTNSGIT